MNERKNRPQGPQGFRRQDRPQAQEPVEENEGQLEGRNAIQEALKSGRTIDKLFVASGDTDKGLQRLAAQAKEAGAVVVPVDRRKLDAMSFTRSHQGVIALCAAHDYYTIDDILAEAAARGQAPLIVICDELSDPHNLGAILRSAECAGAHGVIIPKRRSVGLTATVAKASAGAMEYMKVARVTNINNAIAELKDLRYRRRGLHPHVPGRPEGSRRHRHRQRGGRHEPSGAEKLRCDRTHSHGGQDQLSQRLCGGIDSSLRGGASAVRLNWRTL